MRQYSGYSRDTALASYAAWDQGKFWEMHDLLYENAPDLEREVLDSLALKLGLDMDRFRKAMDEKAHLDELQGNLDRVHELDIWSTPTVIINGVMIKGVQPYERYRELIEEALASSSRSGPLHRIQDAALRILSPAEVFAETGEFGRGRVPLWVQAPRLKPVNDLKVGDAAPDFTLPNAQGGEITLSAFKGSKNVLISFLPAAFTPT
ncbi:MAG: thioredoxin domain-containing protein [bacterium]|nr:MAG: thioredoxin domain-containing protein [bacterium]